MTQQTAPVVTLPAQDTVEPFSKITLMPQADGSLLVKAMILLDRFIEGTATGIAIDGSGTMMPWFGAQGGTSQNIVAPFAQQMCAYLAAHAADQYTVAIYWATGSDGQGIEEIGQLRSDQAQMHPFQGPQVYGNRTCLLPALDYFVARFHTAKWSLMVFITDGRLDDLEDVKAATVRLCTAIAKDQRQGMKCIIIGVGHRIEEQQLRELDNLDTGTGIDLWDYKTAHTMKHLAEIFAEVVDENTIVTERGFIRDHTNKIVQDYRDSGVPALMTFTLPAGAPSFTLELDEYSVTQPIQIPPRSA